MQIKEDHFITNINDFIFELKATDKDNIELLTFTFTKYDKNHKSIILEKYETFYNFFDIKFYHKLFEIFNYIKDNFNILDIRIKDKYITVPIEHIYTYDFIVLKDNLLEKKQSIINKNKEHNGIIAPELSSDDIKYGIMHTLLNKDCLMNIPINEIDYDIYKQYKYDKNMIALCENEETRVIIIDEMINGKFKLIDGRHRCFCANELGYTHIPAIVTRRLRNLLIGNDKYKEIEIPKNGSFKIII